MYYLLSITCWSLNYSQAKSVNPNTNTVNIAATGVFHPCAPPLPAPAFKVVVAEEPPPFVTNEGAEVRLRVPYSTFSDQLIEETGQQRTYPTYMGPQPLVTQL